MDIKLHSQKSEQYIASDSTVEITEFDFSTLDSQEITLHLYT